jgi:hypothetical protein
MSWNYELGIVFDDYQPPVSRFLMISNFAKTSPSLGKITFLGVYKTIYSNIYDKDGNLVQGGPVEKISYPQSLELIEQSIQHLAEKYSGEDYLVEGMWAAHRYEDLDQLEDYWAKIVVTGKQFHPPLDAHIPPVMYIAGDSNFFNSRPGNESLVEKNMELLVEELKYIINMGIRSIHGYDGDLSADPHEYSLCYHRDLSDFVDDIYWNSEKPSDLIPLTFDTVMEVAKTCDHLEAVQYGNGVLVYNRHGVSGDLRQFYELLTLKLQANH